MFSWFHTSIFAPWSANGIRGCGGRLSLGGSAGLLYNRNQLEPAYVFQSHPALRGFKTLVDLNTDGFWRSWRARLLYRPTDTLHAALSGPFVGVQPDFAYDAEVENTFPQMITAGGGWQASADWPAARAGRMDNWSDSFDALPLRLRNSNNADLNTFLGSDAIDDTILLNWEDQFVCRTGVEYTPGDHWAFVRSREQRFRFAKKFRRRSDGFAFA